MADGTITTVLFPGINTIIEASADTTLGITPGMAVLTICPQGEIPTIIGDLEFFYTEPNGNETYIKWHNARVDEASLQRNSSGEVWQVTILDRRWAWKFGRISGQYNLRRNDGSIMRQGTSRTTERMPSELASLCLQAMGERDYDTSAIPNDTRPEVLWDSTNPSEALAALCDELGCAIDPGYSNRVRIVRIGVGDNLPITDKVVENGITESPVFIPRKITIVTEPYCCQVDLFLEPVAKETDGRILPLDDVSYAPTGVKYWPERYADTYGDPVADFSHLLTATPGSTTYAFQKRQVALAKATWFKWYRVTFKSTTGADMPLVVPQPYGAPLSIEDLDLILPLHDEQLDQEYPPDPASYNKLTEKVNRPAWVYGMYELDGPIPDDNTTVSNTCDPQLVTGTIPRQYTLETETGIVKFSEPIYRLVQNAGVWYKLPAMLWLRTTITPRDYAVNSPLRYTFSRTYGASLIDVERVEKRSDITLKAIVRYSISPSVSVGYQSPSGGTNNLAETNAQCNYWIDSIEKEYLPDRPQIVKYIGLFKIPLDGKIRQVSFTVSQSGTFTTACMNTEQAHRVLPYKERRRLEKERTYKEAVESQQRLVDAQRRKLSRQKFLEAQSDYNRTQFLGGL